ncbi:hypothetical protein RIF29_20550 [Crotalaria pallida]|uniref:SEP domain-containing protein n=1 Tax=Crotalaria pallida TaxID=3830 RepID=A0AAN9F5T4_CROPI
MMKQMQLRISADGIFGLPNDGKLSHDHERAGMNMRLLEETEDKVNLNVLILIKFIFSVHLLTLNRRKSFRCVLSRASKGLLISFEVLDFFRVIPAEHLIFVHMYIWYFDLALVTDFLTVHYISGGMLVQNPTMGNDVDAIFNQARQLGAVERPLDQLQEPPRSTSFTGTSRLLSGETVQSAPQQPETVVHNIVFWSNGFTVNDGPLRSLDDPENASFSEVTSFKV